MAAAQRKMGEAMNELKGTLSETERPFALQISIEIVPIPELGDDLANGWSGATRQTVRC